MDMAHKLSIVPCQVSVIGTTSTIGSAKPHSPVRMNLQSKLLLNHSID